MLVLLITLLLFVESNGNFPCEKKKTSKKYGNYTAIKLAKDSKFVWKNIGPSQQLSYAAAEGYCLELGLELAQITTGFDIFVLRQYFVDLENRPQSFWIAAISPVDGTWVYPNQEPLIYNAFWGLGPTHVPTLASNGASNRTLLKWEAETTYNKTWLVMVDAEMENNFFHNKSFLCQFPMKSECSERSREVKEFKKLELEKDAIAPLNVTSTRHVSYYISRKQKTNVEAHELCTSNDMTVLKLIQDIEPKVLFDGIVKGMAEYGLRGGVTGFWVGKNDVFHPDHAINWQWMSERIDLLNPMGMARKGHYRYIGKCLALAVLDIASKSFHLQPVSCNLPQWVICEKLKVTRKQRSVRDDSFKVNCNQSPQFQDQFARPVPNSGCKKYWKCVRVVGSQYVFNIYVCPGSSFFNIATSQCDVSGNPASCEPHRPTTTTTKATTTTTTTARISTTIDNAPMESTTFTYETESTTIESLTAITFTTTSIGTDSTPTIYTTPSISTDATPTTTEPTTEVPYTNITCSIRTPVHFGSIKVTRMGDNSKFLFFEYPKKSASTYKEMEKECEFWGLELPQIKAKTDLNTIQEFLDYEIEDESLDTSYWLSGYDLNGHGSWTYSTGLTETIKFQRFWGMSPIYTKIGNEITRPSHLILRGAIDPIEKERHFYMLDVDAEDEFFKEKGLICQFPASSRDCTYHSDEEFLSRGVESRSNNTVLVGVLSGIQIYYNPSQKTKMEAVQFCKLHNMSLMDVNILAGHGEELFDLIFKAIGNFAGFWIDQNDLFTKSAFSWDWVNNVLLKPWDDEILKFKGRISEARQGYWGKCLVLGVVDLVPPKKFYLQTSPCGLPQHTVCVEAEI